MKVRISSDNVRTFHGIRKVGDLVDLPVHEAITLIKSGDAEAEGPTTEQDDTLPFGRMNGMMKPPMVS